jgi:hypothetical protein
MRMLGRPTTLGRVRVEVTNADVEDVLVPIGSSLQVNGRIRAEGDEKPSFAATRIALTAADAMPLFFSMPVAVKEDGSFQITEVGREKYRPSVTGLPEKAYIKAVRSGGADIFEKDFDLTQADSAADLEIVISMQAGAVAGVVRAEDKPAPGAAVILMPEPSTPARLYLRKNASSDQNGNFTIQGVAPGEYRLYAVDEMPMMMPFEADPIKRYEGRGLKVVVREGSREQVDLKLLKPQ